MTTPATPERLIGGALQPVPRAVRQLAEPIVHGLGLELLGVELAQEGARTVLWVFIDSEEGVTIDDCARVSPELSAALDVDDPVPTAYELRVSSPGLDRPLIRASDFVEFAGQDAQLQLSTPLGGRRKFTGTLDGVDGDDVLIRCSDGDHRVPLSAIHRARLRYEIEVGKRRR
ncbi:MAG: ribosome maturation factor RimP [Myxococcales bacterium]|nr:ribosome maturation factor RimP [Myxococcales bacterium]MCB9538369.1 ribosome maturation factor RimP [Myxococcales bacterium]